MAHGIIYIFKGANSMLFKQEYLIYSFWFFCTNSPTYLSTYLKLIEWAKWKDLGNWAIRLWMFVRVLIYWYELNLTMVVKILKTQFVDRLMLQFTRVWRNPAPFCLLIDIIVWLRCKGNITLIKFSIITWVRVPHF